jgi:hypothetical protein
MSIIRKKEISEKLEAIETVIWMFDAEWDPARVRPNYPRRRYLKNGAISRTAYAVLRDAKMRTLRACTVARGVC